MGEFLRDFEHAARLLFRRPAFAAVAVTSLALGIGLDTTLFSVVNAVLLRETPVERPEGLVEIYSSASEEIPHFTSSFPDLLSIRQGTDVFSGIAGHAYVRGIVTNGDHPALATGEVVTANYFDVLGVRPVLGRSFRNGEDAVEGQAPVAILSHGLWQGRFGGRAGVLGETLDLSGVRYTIVGVAPVSFAGTLPGLDPEFWVPLTMADRLSFSGLQSVADVDPGETRISRRGTRWLFVTGRLRDGRRIEEARAQVETVFSRLRTEYPATNEKTKPSVLAASSVRFHPMLDGYVKAASAVLLTAVGLYGVIAYSVSLRTREVGVRMALGARPGDVLQLVLLQGARLALVGVAIGSVLAAFVGRVLESLLYGVSAIDPIAYGLGAGVLMLAAAAANTVPAVSAARIDPIRTLRAD